MKVVLPASVAFILAGFASGCAAFTPRNVDTAKNIACIIQNAWFPDADILRLCPDATPAEVHAGAEAHRAAVRRQLEKPGVCTPVASNAQTRALLCSNDFGYRPSPYGDDE